jgi:hypothetical protein
MVLKLYFGLSAVLLALLVGSAAVHAQTRPFNVIITDLTDGTPVVTGNFGIPASGAPETIDVVGQLPLTAVAPGIRSVILTDPPGDPFPGIGSDTITLIVQPISTDLSTITILFNSDPLAGLPTNNVQTIPEDGTLQDLSVLLNSGALDIKVQSDVGTTTETPEPATLAIFGIGLAGLGLVRRRKRT